MIKLRRPWITALILFGLMLAAVGGAGAQSSVRIVSGSLSGTWYPLGQVIGEHGVAAAGFDFSNGPGGGVSNIVAVQTGRADLGLSMTVSMDMAANGEAPFPSPMQDVVAIAALHPDPVHVLVAADAGINSLSDLKGKRVAVAEAGQLSRVAFTDLLSAVGLSERDVTLRIASPGDAVSLYKDRHVDAWVYVTPPPSPHASDMAISRASRLLTLNDEEIKALTEMRTGYSVTTIAANTYTGQSGDVTALNTDVVIVVHRSMPDDVAYAITKALVENVAHLRTALAVMQDLTPDRMAQLGTVPAHPGAIRYFEEIGVWQD